MQTFSVVYYNVQFTTPNLESLKYYCYHYEEISVSMNTYKAALYGIRLLAYQNQNHLVRLAAPRQGLMLKSFKPPIQVERPLIDPNTCMPSK